MLSFLIPSLIQGVLAQQDGFLLYGPSGGGKSALTKAVSQAVLELGAPVVELRASDVTPTVWADEHTFWSQALLEMEEAYIYFDT